MLSETAEIATIDQGCGSRFDKPEGLDTRVCVHNFCRSNWLAPALGILRVLVAYSSPSGHAFITVIVPTTATANQRWVG